MKRWHKLQSMGGFNSCLGKCWNPLNWIRKCHQCSRQWDPVYSSLAQWRGHVSLGLVLFPFNTVPRISCKKRYSSNFHNLSGFLYAPLSYKIVVYSIYYCCSYARSNVIATPSLHISLKQAVKILKFQMSKPRLLQSSLRNSIDAYLIFLSLHSFTFYLILDIHHWSLAPYCPYKSGHHLHSSSSEPYTFWRHTLKQATVKPPIPNQAVSVLVFLLSVKRKEGKTQYF